MKPVDDEQFIDRIGPEFIKRGAGKMFFHFIPVLGGKSDPDLLRLHRHHIVIDRAFLDQPVNIGPVRRDQRCEFIVHLKLYRYLVFLHVFVRHKDNNKAQAGIV